MIIMFDYLMFSFKLNVSFALNVRESKQCFGVKATAVVFVISHGDTSHISGAVSLFVPGNTTFLRHVNSGACP